MSVIHVSSDSEYSDLIRNTKGKIVVVDFFATWCGPCKAIEGSYNSLAKKYANGKFLKVDVDVLKQTSSDAGVTAMPTFQVGEVRGADIKSLENIILNYYEEPSFSGTGTKLGASEIKKDSNPFDILFKRYHDIVPKNSHEGPIVDCEIFFKFPDGKVEKYSFKSNEDISTIHNFIKTNHSNLKLFKLVNSYPRRVYEGDLLYNTIAQEKLTNRGQLNIILV